MPDHDHVHQYRLLIFGDGSVRTITLTGDAWTIGRSQECSVALRDPTVSRRHLVLERTGADFQFRDLGGANPPVLDGRTVRQGSLGVGQQLTIGLTKLVLEARQAPAAVTTNQGGTVIISREVYDDEIEDEGSESFPATAAKVLQSIEWTFADLGDLAHAADPLVELALNLTQRRAGWLVRFPAPGTIETLAVRTTDGREFSPQLSEAALTDARKIKRPHMLSTVENGRERERLVVPLGDSGEGLLVLERPGRDAPSGQELLRLARSLGKVVWHRLQETIERVRMRDELERLRFHGTDAHQALLTSTRLQATREHVRARAGRDEVVLLVGEPGTEREDLARYLHAESPHRGAPFVTWNAAASPPNKQPLEVFGNGEHLGLLQRTAGGTLFIDEPAAMPIELQQELAVAIMECAELPATARPRLVFAADRYDDAPTKPSAGEQPEAVSEVAAKELEARRPTLAPELHRFIATPPITIPPLREDARDVLALAELFLSGLGTNPDGSPRLMTERCKRLLTTHAWPGNVRELRLTVEHAAAKAGNQPITPRHLPPEITRNHSPETPDLPSLEDIERAHIQEVMVRTGGVRSRAAQILGIANSTLYEKLKKYEIE